MRFYIKVFGCRLNQYYAEYFANSVLESGHEVIDSEKDADVVAVASCVVTHKAERDLRHYVSHIRNVSPNSKVVVFGCYPKFKTNLDVDLSGDIHDVLKELELDDKGVLSFIVSRVRGNVRVQEGCNFRCSYCVVPKVRGPSRSRAKEEILTEVSNLYYSGVPEVVLTGIQTGAWGRELGSNLYNLVSEIKEKFPDLRIRLSSISPIHINDGIIELLKNGAVLPHLHLPLQHGSEKVLKEMRRPYKLSFYVELVNRLVTEVPNIAIGSDIIVGFPTETEEDFEISLDVVNSLPFAYLHIFEFSPREGTDAHKMKLLPSEVVKNRKKYLLDLAKRKKLTFFENNLNRVVGCVIEKQEQNYYEGTTDNYIKVKVIGSGLKPGDVKTVRITKVIDDELMAEGRILD